MLRLVGSEFAHLLRVRANPRSRTPDSSTSRSDCLIVLALERIAATLDKMASGFPAQVRAGEVAAPVAGGVSIDEAVARWRDDLTARGCRPRSIDRMVSTVERVADYSGWSAAAHVDYTGAVAFLADRRRADPPWSGPTHDQAVSTLRTFGEFLRRCRVTPINTLEDLESCGEPGEQGPRALTPDEARRIIEASIDRHMESRRARGCAPLFWLHQFYTGLRYSESRSARWSDYDLDAGMIYTDPKWVGNKAKRRDTIPIRADMLELLIGHRDRVPHGPKDPVFPKVPNLATWHKEREAAGIPLLDPRKRRATIHSCRKSFCTWLDSQNIPRGVVSRLARHAVTLTERAYIDHSGGVDRQAVESLPQLWFPCGGVFSIRTRKNLANRVDAADTPSVQAFNPMVSTPSTSRSSAPGRTAALATPEQRGSSALRPGAENRDDAASGASIRVDNGQGQPPNLSGTNLQAEAEVAIALAHWLNRRTGAAPSEEPADDRDHKEAV
jgi:integrase